jgi:hypothetical protein
MIIFESPTKDRGNPHPCHVIACGTWPYHFHPNEFQAMVTDRLEIQSILVLAMAAEVHLSVFKRVTDGQAGQQDANGKTIDSSDHFIESRTALQTKLLSNLFLLLVIRAFLSKVLAGVDCFYHSPDAVVHRHQAHIMRLHYISGVIAKTKRITMLSLVLISRRYRLVSAFLKSPPHGKNTLSS